MDLPHIFPNNKITKNFFTPIKNLHPLYRKLIFSAIGLFVMTLGTGAGLVLVQQSQDVQTGASCNADPAGTNYGSPCSPNGAIDCGGDGKETVCTNGTWHATGACCSTGGGGNPPPPPPGSGSCPSGQWSCGVACADSSVQQLFNNHWCDGHARWLHEAGQNQGINCGGSASSPRSEGCGTGGNPPPPPGGSPGAGWSVTCTNGHTQSVSSCSVHDLFNRTWPNYPGGGCARWHYEACQNVGSSVASGACGACSGGGGSQPTATPTATKPPQPTPPPPPPGGESSACKIVGKNAQIITNSCSPGEIVTARADIDYIGNCSGTVFSSLLRHENKVISQGGVVQLQNTNTYKSATSNVTGRVENTAGFYVVGYTEGPQTNVWTSSTKSCKSSSTASCVMSTLTGSVVGRCIQGKQVGGFASVSYSGNCDGANLSAELVSIRTGRSLDHKSTTLNNAGSGGAQKTVNLSASVPQNATGINVKYTYSNQSGESNTKVSNIVNCTSEEVNISISVPVTNSFADLNDDKYLDIADYNELFVNWKQPVSQTNSKTDINKDGRVDALDYTRFFEEWNNVVNK